VALNDDEPELTPAELRRSRIQVVLLLVPLAFTIAVILVRALT
jgi:hypothetical protein